MDMEIIMILLIWLVAPFAEAGVIIGLAIANGRHKKRIQELTCQLERQRLYGFEREKTRAGEMPPDPPKPETLSDGWLVPASIVKASWGQTGKTIVVPQEYPNTVHIINRNKGPEPAPEPNPKPNPELYPEPAPEPDHPVRIRKAQPCF